MNDKAKFTIGPWRIGNIKMEPVATLADWGEAWAWGECRIHGHDNERTVATVGFRTDDGALSPVASRLEAIANAKLVSCAPELLERLKEIVEALETRKEYINLSPAKEIIDRASGNNKKIHPTANGK